MEIKTTEEIYRLRAKEWTLGNFDISKIKWIPLEDIDVVVEKIAISEKWTPYMINHWKKKLKRS